MDLDLTSLAGIRCSELDENLTEREKELFDNFDNSFKKFVDMEGEERQTYINENFSYPDKMPPNIKDGDYIPGYGLILNICYTKPGTKESL